MSEPISKADLERAIAGAVKELKEYVDEHTKELKEHIDERTHDAETLLLRGFVDYSSSDSCAYTSSKGRRTPVTVLQWSTWASWSAL